MEVSLIITSYNNSWIQVRRTLLSCILQKFSDFEVIVADDASTINHFDKIRQLFSEYHFTEYKLLSSESNVGTVKNFLNAVNDARGQYIKGLGAGDMLYDENSIEKAYYFMNKSKSNIVFSDMMAYSITDNIVTLYPNQKYPERPEKFLQGSEIAIKEVAIYGRPISGAVMFYKKEFLIEYLCKISGILKYCEDQLQVLAFLNDENVDFLNEILVWYELGTGISHKQAKKGENSIISIDIGNLYRSIEAPSRYSHYIKRARKRYSIILDEKGLIKKCILLLFCSPSYLFNVASRRLEKILSILRYKRISVEVGIEQNGLGFLSNTCFYL
jgi:glycosyltransferase involved in cell wall biosynthesis